MPSDLTGQVGGAFNAFFNSAIVQLFMISVILYLFVVWLAAAYWAFRDMHERSENPVLPYLAAGLIILCTPFLFVLGVLVYRVIRPTERLGEVYERNLAEEALLAEVEAIKTCRNCDRRVERRVDSLPLVPGPTKSRLPQLRQAGRPGLDLVRLVRQGFRASRGSGASADARARCFRARATPCQPRRCHAGATRQR